MKLRVAILACAVTFLPISNSDSAFAHAAIESTLPAKGAVVAQSTNKVVMQFGEELLVLEGKSPNSIIVSDSHGKKVSTGRVAISGTKISIALKAPLNPGKYTVKYRVVSADGHVVSGSYTFTVK